MAHQHHHANESCKVDKLPKNTDFLWEYKCLFIMFQYLIMLIDSFSSGFVFLRLICPAILNPRMFNIISGEHLLKRAQTISSLLTLWLATVHLTLLFPFADPPSSTAGRTLTLVAKSVQNLANLVEFGAKVWILSFSFYRKARVEICLDLTVVSAHEQEPYMEGVNPFIKNNKHRMIMFLDELGVSHICCRKFKRLVHLNAF